MKFMSKAKRLSSSYDGRREKVKIFRGGSISFLTSKFTAVGVRILV